MHTIDRMEQGIRYLDAETGVTYLILKCAAAQIE
jgi:hypothetical protein